MAPLQTKPNSPDLYDVRECVSPFRLIGYTSHVPPDDVRSVEFPVPRRVAVADFSKTPYNSSDTTIRTVTVQTFELGVGVSRFKCWTATNRYIDELSAMGWISSIGADHLADFENTLLARIPPVPTSTGNRLLDLINEVRGTRLCQGPLQSCENQNLYDVRHVDAPYRLLGVTRAIPTSGKFEQILTNDLANPIAVRSMMLSVSGVPFDCWVARDGDAIRLTQCGWIVSTSADSLGGLTIRSASPNTQPSVSTPPRPAPPPVRPTNRMPSSWDELTASSASTPRPKAKKTATPATEPEAPVILNPPRRITIPTD